MINKYIKKILRNIKRFFDFLIGDLSDQIYFKYIYPYRVKWDKKNSYKIDLTQKHRDFLIKLILSDKKTKKILELGCGLGVNLIKLSQTKKVLDLYGIDISNKQIKIGNQLIDKLKLKIKLKEGNIKNLKIYNDNEFDVVFTDASLIYIDKKNIFNTLENALRICSKKLFICEQDTDGIPFYNDKWVHNYKEIFA